MAAYHLHTKRYVDQHSICEQSVHPLPGPRVIRGNYAFRNQSIYPFTCILQFQGYKGRIFILAKFGRCRERNLQSPIGPPENWKSWSRTISTIVLYDYWRSSASYRVRIALGLAGLKFKSVQINLLDGEHRSAAHRHRNPQGLVPALEIDGLMLTQSLAIIEYLHETGRGNFLHGSAENRAMTRAVSQAIAMEIHPICNLSITRHVTSASGGSIEIKSWMNTFISKGLAAVEEMLRHFEDRAFCCGDEISIADICLIPQIYNAIRWDIDLSPYRRIREVVREAEKLPAIRAAHPDNFKPKGATS